MANAEVGVTLPPCVAVEGTSINGSSLEILLLTTGRADVILDIELFIIVSGSTLASLNNSLEILRRVTGRPRFVRALSSSSLLR